MRIQALLTLTFVVLGTAIAAPLHADERIIPPSVTKIWPVGIERGTTATFALEGRNLSDIKAVVFDSAGITAKVTQVADIPEETRTARAGVDLVAVVARGKKQTITMTVTAAQDVPPGIHWFRVRTPLGTSNISAFDVGSFPEVAAEGGPNGGAAGLAMKEEDPEARAALRNGVIAATNPVKGGPDQPTPAALPATLVGTIAVPGQIDRYEFEGTAGEELAFQVVASPVGSRLESLLTLRNDSGDVLAEAGRNENRADAVLTYKLPSAGKYTLSVTDREKAGSKNHFYRVNAGPLPYVANVFPLGVRAGEPATVSVTGVNLGDVHEVKVNPPESSAGWTTMPLPVKTPTGWSLNTISLAVGNDPEILEQEPNNSLAQAQRVPLPITINGRISGGAMNGGAADEDYFRFHARKGEALDIEVAASRLGSPLDSVIEILDAKGNPIPRATIRCLNETTSTLSDRDSKTPGIRVNSITGFHEGNYVMVGDELDQLVYIADQPDEDIKMRAADGMRWALLGTSADVHAINTPVYRVEVLPPGSEFPANGLPVFHLAWRNDDGGPGFGSDSQLDFVAPQDGDYLLHLKDVRGLAGNNFSYRLTLHDARPDFELRADPGNPNIPKGGAAFIAVSANRVRGYEGPIEVSVEGLAAGVTATHAQIPAGQDSTVILLSADQSTSDDAPPAPFKIVGRAKVDGHDLARVANEGEPLELASVVPPPDVVVTATPAQVSLEPGQDVKVTLRVERRSGFQGRVPCKVQNLPPGVRVVNIGLNGVLVTETQTQRTFTLHAEEWAKPITQPIYVVGEVESNSPTMHPSAPLVVDVVGSKEVANNSK